MKFVRRWAAIESSAFPASRRGCIRSCDERQVSPRGVLASERALESRAHPAKEGHCCPRGCFPSRAHQKRRVRCRCLPREDAGRKTKLLRWDALRKREGSEFLLKQSSLEGDSRGCIRAHRPSSIFSGRRRSRPFLRTRAGSRSEKTPALAASWGASGQSKPHLLSIGPRQS